MRIEGLVGRTMRARPSGASAAMGMAARAGLLRPEREGWVVLPLGVRILERMSSTLLQGLECCPVRMPVPREDDVGRALSALMQRETQSYRQLPLRIATSWEGRANALAPATQAEASSWLAAAGAFADEKALAGFLSDGRANLHRVAACGGVALVSAEGSAGARALMAVGSAGQSIALECSACGSSHLREWAPFARERLEPGAAGAMLRVHTPGAMTIQALAAMLGVERERTLKALFLCTETNDLVFAVLRGDLEASMAKISRATGGVGLRPATDTEILAAGACPGFASPVGMRVREAGGQGGVLVVADHSVYSGDDFAAGANAEDYHFVHVDPKRDFSVTEAADIALAPAGARCAACGGALTERTGTIVARSYPLDPPCFSDEAGREERAVAAWTVVDLLALFEQVVSACADDDGIAWPPLLAPADVHVLSLKEQDACCEIVEGLEREGLSVLFDDRPIGAGAKFADADLIGCPVRVTISPRSLQAGGAEVAGRRGDSPDVAPLGQLPARVRARLASLMST